MAEFIFDDDYNNDDEDDGNDDGGNNNGGVAELGLSSVSPGTEGASAYSNSDSHQYTAPAATQGDSAWG